MAHPVFLIDLASARPPTSPSTEHWPALAKEHGNQLTRCIRRIITHTNAKSVTTHLFDSTVLTHIGELSTKPVKDALEGLNRIPAQVANLDITGVRHPTARGVLAGLTDAAPEDNFSDFYLESKTERDIYVFSRAPGTRAALAAFIGKKELALSSLERNLADLPYLRSKLKAFAKRGDRLIWVNSTPRRCERGSDVDPKVEQVFSKWLLSHSSEFRFVNLHSFLLDRRIVPAKTIVGSLWDGSVGNDLGLGTLVEVLCLQDSQLLRCFSAQMNVLDTGVTREKTSETALVLSGLVRNYGTEELTKFDAFDKPARLLTPASNLSGDDPGYLNSSIFAGLMVDLARQNMCLIADFFEVNETEGFIRYQTLLQPITPLSAALRKVSRTEAFINYNSSCLPQSIEEWRSWDKFENVKDCDITDSVIDASAKFFETYLPDLFSIPTRDITGVQRIGAAKHASEKVKVSQNDHMLLSFEGNTASLPNNSQAKFTVFSDGVDRAPKALKRDRVMGPRVINRDLIVKQLRVQQDVLQEKKLKASPKTTPKKQAQMQKFSDQQQLQTQEEAMRTKMKVIPQKQYQTPQKSAPNKQNKVSPKSASKFKWNTRSQAVAPSDVESHKCVDAHLYNKKGERSHVASCKNKEKKEEIAAGAAKAVVRSESIVHASLSPTTPEDGRYECFVSGAMPKCNVAPMKTREIVADPDVLQYTSERGSCSPEPVNTTGSSERKQTSRSTIQLESAIDQNEKQNADVLVNEDLESLKRVRSLNHPPVETDEGLKFERDHENFIRRAQIAFSECLSKLHAEDPDATEKIVWESVNVLSSIAEALCFHHKLQCGIDHIINLNLKIPNSMSEAVQTVHNKVKNDDFSPNVVVREIWETILSAFEQAMWHLAAARRKALKKLGKKRVSRQVHEVSKILTCAQFMAETVANSYRQPVSFRCVFSTLFSSVFVHLGRKESGEPIPEIVSLFEKFEQPLPTQLQPSSNDGKISKGEYEAIEKCSYPRSGVARRTQTVPVRSLKHTSSSIRSRKGPLGSNMASKTATERSRAAQTEPSTIVAHARKPIPKIILGRPQFAKESEAIRNAMNSQTRLPLQSTKSGIKNKSRLNTANRRISKKTPDRSTLQDILVNTVPAPVIEAPSADELGEDSVEQTPPPRFQNEKIGKAVDKARNIRDAGVQDISDGRGGPAGSPIQKEKNSNQEQKQASTNEKRKQAKPLKDACEKIGSGSDFSRLPSATLDKASKSPVTKAKSKQKHVDTASSLGFGDVTPTKTSRVQRRQNDKDKKLDIEHRNVSGSARPATRLQMNHILAEKIREEQESTDASPEASRRLTRSQAKQKTRKRRLETSPSQESSLGSSRQKKKRQRKHISSDPKPRCNATNVLGYESSPKSPSPTTRSKVKAVERKASLQLRNRSVNRPRQPATVKPVTQDVVEDTETLPMTEQTEVPKTPALRPCTPTGNMLSPAPLCQVTPWNVLSPETPVARVDCSQKNSALHRIVNSSLEKRKGELGEEDFIPETPVAPKSSVIVPPTGRSVRRTLVFGNE